MAKDQSFSYMRMRGNLETGQKKRTREDGVPTVFELADMIRNFEQFFLDTYLLACSKIMTHKDTFKVLRGIGHHYVLTVKIPESDDPDHKLTDEGLLKMEQALNRLWDDVQRERGCVEQVPTVLSWQMESSKKLEK